MTFVDTNYFLRFLLKDNTVQHEVARKLFKDGATGSKELITSIIVFFEIYWVLSSFYGKKKEELLAVLHNIMSMSFVKINERELLEEALVLFSKENLSLEDCYNLVYAKGQKSEEFLTFDQRLSRQYKASPE